MGSPPAANIRRCLRLSRPDGFGISEGAAPPCGGPGLAATLPEESTDIKSSWVMEQLLAMKAVTAYGLRKGEPQRGGVIGGPGAGGNPLREHEMKNTFEFINPPVILNAPELMV